MYTKIFMTRLGTYFWKIFRFFLLVGLGFVLLYPILYMISNAVKPPEQIMDPGIVWIPRSVTLENFKTAISLLGYWDSLGQTLLIGGISSVLQVIVCSLVGYGFARFDFKFKKLAFCAVLFTIVVPAQTILVPLYLMYNNFSIPLVGDAIQLITGVKPGVNLLDTVYVFYLPAILGVGIRSGIYIFIFRQFFKQIPKALEEAGTIDGCNAFNIFIRIMIPSSGNSFLTVFLFSLVWYWNDYYHSSIFLTSKRTLSVALTTLKGSLSAVLSLREDPYVMVTRMQAGALLTILPLLILYIFLQKYFTESIDGVGIVG